MNKLLLDALHCKNIDRPPVWLMRQAGRYMPEYRALRSHYSLWQLFHEPELAAQVTLQPIDVLGVDAAILFSDILVIAEVFGLDVVFPDGSAPQILPVVSSVKDLVRKEIKETLSYVMQTIELLKPKLHVPLIGFCGAPFTLSTYLTGGKTAEWIMQRPQEFHQLLEMIADALIAYLQMQIHAGVDVVQIFDSWANLLSPSQFFTFAYPYLKKMIEALSASRIPIILFSRAASRYPEELSGLCPAAISFDSQKQMDQLRKSVPSHIAVQGNIDPEFLKIASTSEVAEKTKSLLVSMKGDSGFVANLGHGVLPGTPMGNVHAFVDTVKSSL